MWMRLEQIIPESARVGGKKTQPTLVNMDLIERVIPNETGTIVIMMSGFELLANMNFSEWEHWLMNHKEE